jgi:hypothetical protein
VNLETLAHILPTLQQNFASRLGGFSFKTGARFLDDNSGGNRVVFVPLRDSFEPGRQQRGVARVTRTRVVTLQAFIWAVPTRLDNSIFKRGEAFDPDAGRDSIGQAEAAINALMCALEDSCLSGQYDVSDGEWQDQNGESVSEYGVRYVLTFTIRVPVVYDEAGAATVTAAAIGYVESDGTTITTPPP